MIHLHIIFLSLNLSCLHYYSEDLVWTVVVAQLVERRQRSAVQIPTSAKFYLPIVRINRKEENKEKEAGNGPSFYALKT